MLNQLIATRMASNFCITFETPFSSSYLQDLDHHFAMNFIEVLQQLLLKPLFRYPRVLPNLDIQVIEFSKFNLHFTKVTLQSLHTEMSLKCKIHTKDLTGQAESSCLTNHFFAQFLADFLIS